MYIGVWGKYPDKFTSFDGSGKSKAYLTSHQDVTYTTTTPTATTTTTPAAAAAASNNNNNTFIFDINKAVYMPYYKTYKTDKLCNEIGGNKDIAVGEYILTIVPLTKDNIMISYLILP